MRSGPDNRKANGKQALYGPGSYKGTGGASSSSLKVQKPSNKTAGNGVTNGSTGSFRQSRGAGKSRTTKDFD